MDEMLWYSFYYIIPFQPRQWWCLWQQSPSYRIPSEGFLWGRYLWFGLLLVYLALLFSNHLFNLFSPAGEKSHACLAVYLWRTLQSCKALKPYTNGMRIYRRGIVCTWTNPTGTQPGDRRNEGCGQCARRVPLAKREWKTASYLCRLVSFHPVFFFAASFYSLGFKRKNTCHTITSTNTSSSVSISILMQYHEGY